jgi:hypothetical protein
MRVLLTSSGISVDGKPLKAAMNANDMGELAGAPVRTKDMPMHPSGIRRQNVSNSGIVWYVDYPEGQVSHFLLALSPKDTPGSPDSVFIGSVGLNGSF